MSHTEMSDFQEKLEAKFGLIFDQHRREQVEQTFLALRSEMKLSAQEFLQHLDDDSTGWERAADLLTVPESYFFRHTDMLRAFQEIALPERVAAHSTDREIRILSIGCANGEEPYTLSMLCLERAQEMGGCEVSIQGYDISPDAIQRARQGLYTEWALRATAPHYKSRYFESTGKKFRLADEVRRPVTFKAANVLDLDTPHRAGSIDIIFFRNVLIYFSPAAIRSAIRTVTHLLAPGGYLFLGPVENLRGISEDFHLCHTHETFYYQRKTQLTEQRAFANPVSSYKGAPREVPSLTMAAASTVWMDEIGLATERIRGVHERPKETRNPRKISEKQTRPSAANEIQRILSMLTAEKYDDALNILENLPGELLPDPDLLLLRALTHLNRRELGQAETVCRALLAGDELNASGHYLFALCREYASDPGGAMDHDRSAIYLDPTFAMPHLHLALMARKSGDTYIARREFETANLLLAREDATRIMMFGGGFSREGLRDLCRRELKALGRR